MLFLLKNIRRKLLANNKVGTYILYAIGEITLVVVGILIAVSIDNWNSDRIQKAKEQTYLRNILRDLEEQLIKIDDQVEFESKVAEVAYPIIDYYKKSKSFQVDSAFTAGIGLLTGRVTFIKIDPTFSELVTSGNIDIIRDEKIKNELVIYFKGLERLEQIINKNNQHFTDNVFTREVLGLSEVQLALDYKLMIMPIQIKQQDRQLIDLNEDRLKELTRAQLQKPENELLLINMINFRHYLAIAHLDFMNTQKDKTHALITQLKKL